MTLLIYRNDEWQSGGACRLRVLYNEKDLGPYAAEVPPTIARMFGFLRSNNSWRGHQPFSGERRVVQTAWLVDGKELERKKERDSLAQCFKEIFGR
jgi:hypothetical protein